MKVVVETNDFKDLRVFGPGSMSIFSSSLVQAMKSIRNLRVQLEQGEPITDDDLQDVYMTIERFGVVSRDVDCADNVLIVYGNPQFEESTYEVLRKELTKKVRHQPCKIRG